MSAALSPSNTFSARLTLAAGVLVMIEAPSMSALGEIVGKLEAANDATAAPGKPKAATAAGTQPAPQSAASSAQGAAAKGAEGNGASTATPGTAQPAASGSASGGEAGNGTGGPAAAASPASSSTPAASAKVLPDDAKEAFDVVKKLFLTLPVKHPLNGRAACEAVNKKFGVLKLSENKPENYEALYAELQAADKDPAGYIAKAAA